MSSLSVLIVLVAGLMFALSLLGGMQTVGGALDLFGGVTEGYTGELSGLAGNSDTRTVAEATLDGAQDATVDIVFVPFVYRSGSVDPETTQQYEQDVEGITTGLADETALRSADIETQVIDPAALSPPEITVSSDRAELSCREAVRTAYEFAQDNGYASDADKIVVWVNGTVSGQPVIVQSTEVAGCTNGVGGDVSVIERSIVQQRPQAVALHELGHAFGLCHTQGNMQDGSCNMELQPARSDACVDRNNPQIEGEGDIMNYCLPLEFFSSGQHDEYRLLEERFLENGWIQ